jgi:hypothetical protein
MTVDKVAANRFIKHAIAQATRVQIPTSEPTEKEPIPGPSKIQIQPVPTGAANKMLVRAEWEKQAQETSEEEEGLEVFDETEGYADADADVEMTDENLSKPAHLPMGTEKSGMSFSSYHKPSFLLIVSQPAVNYHRRIYSGDQEKEEGVPKDRASAHWYRGYGFLDQLQSAPSTT